MLKQKKGQNAIGMIIALVAGLIVLSILIVVGLNIQEETQDTTIDETSTATSTNESLGTMVELVTVYLAQPEVASSSIVVVNATNTVIPAGNYTFVQETGAITPIDGTYLNNSVWRATYDYYTLSQAYNATGDMITETSEIPDWIGILVIVVIAVGIIGLLKLFKVF